MDKSINSKTIPKSIVASVSVGCDCYIGNMNNTYLFLSTIKEEIGQTAYMQKVYKDSGIFKDQRAFTPLQIIDNRKGYVLRFKFCPYCGTKVDWKRIVDNLR